MTKPLEKILRAIVEERANQDKKFGPQNHDPEVWLTILMEEVGESSKEVMEAMFASRKKKDKLARAHVKKYRAEMIQVAAVACAAIECLDRQLEEKNDE
jgi:NTP pyrophosphatase (non-canonical NTP hydrolase)